MQDNKVRLVVNGHDEYAFWESVQIESALNTLARTFAISLTAKLPSSDVAIKKFSPSDRVQLFIGQDLVLTGYIDATPISYDANNATFTIQGRSKTADLVDCTVMYPNCEIKRSSKQNWATTTIVEDGRLIPHPKNTAISWRNEKLETIIAQLIAPYDIDLRIVGEQHLDLRVNHDVTLQEGVLEALQHMVKRKDLLIHDNECGNLIIDTKGAYKAYDALVLGQNVLSASANFDAKKLFSVYKVLGRSSGSNTKMGLAINSYSGTFYNPMVTRLRYKCEKYQGQATDALCYEQAENNSRYEIGQYFKTTYTVQGWRQGNGELWKINSLVSVTDPILYLNNFEYLISKVSFSLNNDSGMTTTLEVVPPYGFDKDKNTQGAGASQKVTTATNSNKSMSWINN